eukprot:CAMPEP_0184344952 /NCGR_PEP_ID=MMETSP1089-20130417/13414_1 /TAXON_ID=38269 ORGANISM="Gloeochaete wittrockiana, Strain SAG46.84" /NCGR_SAMPLE_ID=MMETSP1089 /ASSEMBLY_ACC=CAM_ASM_000445 /LENGTH=492 /DNA_ID=CAMNT_0026675061 /DNA_START=44 /DNA_END=1522 /DNA_ORIENTATION=-
MLASFLRQSPRTSARTFVRFASTAVGEEQDLVVIGGGPGGYVAAIKAGQLGKKVTCVEKRKTLGGTCLNVGCIPSKALLNASHHYHDALHKFKSYGINMTGVTLDLDQMMKQKSSAVTGLTSGIKYLFGKNKVNHVEGWGTIASPTEVKVAAADGTSKIIKTKNIVIATGSDVATPPGIAIDEEQIVSSTGALSLKKVPESLIVIGGGVIGLEMGSVWSRLGTQVTVVEFNDAIAAGADLEIAKEFQRVLEKQGIKFKLGHKVTAIKKNAGSSTLTLQTSKGVDAGTMEAEIVLVSVGRKPYTEGLGLEQVGVKLDERGRVVVDDHFSTNVPSIRAIGDVIKGPMLAHKAEDEGLAVVEMIFRNFGHVNYDAIPSVIYTNPEVAWVGKTEEELKKAGVNYRVGKFPLKANSRARTNDDSEGLVKFLSDATTDRILGAHIIGSGAGELIAEPTFAIEYGASTEDIARTCHAHPTVSEAIKEAAMATYDKPIHF